MLSGFVLYGSSLYSWDRERTFNFKRTTVFRLLLICLMALFSASALWGNDPTERLTPLPRQIGENWKNFTLGQNNWQIILANENAELLQLGRETLENALSKVADSQNANAGKFSITCGLLTDELIRTKLENEDLMSWKIKLPAQGYLIRVLDQEIVVAGKDLRGTYYGLMTLIQLADAGILPVADMTDYPLWQDRYSGDYHFYKFEDYRKLSEDKISGYAIQWRKEYFKLDPEKMTAEFAAIRKAVDLEMMDFMLLVHLYALEYFTLENRMNADYFSSVDPVKMGKMISIVRAAASSGVKHVMILADDWTPKVDGRYVCPNLEEREYFNNSVGKAHAEVMNKLAEALWPEFPELELSLCPPIYSINHYDSYQYSEEYFRDFHAAARPEIQLVWTGAQTICTEVAKAEFDTFSSYAPGRRLFQWNNSDCVMPQLPIWQDKFYQGFHEDSDGKIFLNLHTFSWKWNWPYVRTANDYLWNPDGYDAVRSFDAANRKLFGEENVEVIRNFQASMVPLDAACANNDNQKLKEHLPYALECRKLMDQNKLDTTSFDAYFKRLQDFASHEHKEITLPIWDDTVDPEALTPEILEKCTRFDMCWKDPADPTLLQTVIYSGIFGNQMLWVFDMERPDLAKVEMPVQDERDGEIYQNPELIEIFLQPNPAGSYIHFSFDVFGHQAMEINQGKSRDWKPGFTVLIQPAEHSWRGIVLMPLEELERVNPIPPSGEVSWRFNLMRNPADAPFTIFQPTDGFSVHTPQLFAVMKFKDHR